MAETLIKYGDVITIKAGASRLLSIGGGSNTTSSGSANVFLGYQAGTGTTGGNNNVCLGSQTGLGTTSSGCCVLGSQNVITTTGISNSVIIGESATTTNSNTLTFGSQSLPVFPVEYGRPHIFYKKVITISSGGTYNVSAADLVSSTFVFNGGSTLSMYFPKTADVLALMGDYVVGSYIWTNIVAAGSYGIAFHKNSSGSTNDRLFGTTAITTKLGVRACLRVNASYGIDYIL